MLHKVAVAEQARRHLCLALLLEQKKDNGRKWLNRLINLQHNCQNHLRWERS